MVARVPDIADAWFAGRNGCFETPQLGVPPKKISIPKLEVGCYLLFELLSRIIYTYMYVHSICIRNYKKVISRKLKRAEIGCAKWLSLLVWYL